MTKTNKTNQSEETQVLLKEIEPTEKFNQFTAKNGSIISLEMSNEPRTFACNHMVRISADLESDICEAKGIKSTDRESLIKFVFDSINAQCENKLSYDDYDFNARITDKVRNQSNHPDAQKQLESFILNKENQEKKKKVEREARKQQKKVQSKKMSLVDMLTKLINANTEENLIYTTMYQLGYSEEDIKTGLEKAKETKIEEPQTVVAQ